MINDYGLGAEKTEQPILRDLAYALDDPDGRVELRVGDREPIELPRIAIEAFARIALYLAQADFVSVQPVDSLLTTQEVADMLGVSRPYLIANLLGDEKGRIPYETRSATSSHRRVKLADVIRFREQRSAEVGAEGRELLGNSREEYLGKLRDQSGSAPAAKAEARSIAKAF